MSTITDLADAVVAQLNAAPLGSSFVARRTYSPVVERKDLTDRLHVLVMPYGRARELDMPVVDYMVDVGLQAGVGRDSSGRPDRQPSDAVIAILEEIGDYFLGSRVGGGLCVDTEVVLFDTNVLAEFGVLMSRCRLTIRI